MASSHALAQALRAWAHVFMRHSMGDFVRYAREAGVSMQQFGALMYLRQRSLAGVSDLGDEMGVSHAAASQMIERLVQQGLLERTEDPNDRRARHVALTARGQSIVSRSREARQKWIEDLARTLTPEQRAQVIGSLELLTRAAQGLEPETPAELVRPE